MSLCGHATVVGVTLKSLSSHKSRYSHLRVIKFTWVFVRSSERHRGHPRVVGITWKSLRSPENSWGHLRVIKITWVSLSSPESPQSHMRIFKSPVVGVTLESLRLPKNMFWHVQIHQCQTSLKKLHFTRDLCIWMAFMITETFLLVVSRSSFGLPELEPEWAVVKIRLRSTTALHWGGWAL